MPQLTPSLGMDILNDASISSRETRSGTVFVEVIFPEFPETSVVLLVVFVLLLAGIIMG